MSVALMEASRAGSAVPDASAMPQIPHTADHSTSHAFGALPFPTRADRPIRSSRGGGVVAPTRRESDGRGDPAAERLTRDAPCGGGNRAQVEAQRAVGD